jgi:hypothetical protein
MDQLMEPGTLRKQADRLCIAFLEADIDLAFTFLRLARAEIHGGKAGHASERIEKAILTYKTVMKQSEMLPVEFYEEKCEIHERTQRLLESIVASEHQLQILAG